MEDVVIGIIVKDSKVLMIKRKKQEGNLIWGFPGGKVLENESKEDACIREILEETNLEVIVIKSLGHRQHPDTKVNLTYYVCKYLSGEIKVLNKDEILDVAFKTKNEFERDTKTSVFEPVKKYIYKFIK